MGSYVEIKLDLKLNKSIKDKHPRFLSLLNFYQIAYNEDPNDLIEVPFTLDEWLDSEWRDVFEDTFNSNPQFDCLIKSVGDLSAEEIVYSFIEKEDSYELKITSGFKYSSERMIVLDMWTDILLSHILNDELCGWYKTEDNFKRFLNKEIGWHYCDDTVFERDSESWRLDKYNPKNIIACKFRS